MLACSYYVILLSNFDKMFQTVISSPMSLWIFTLMLSEQIVMNIRNLVTQAPELNSLFSTGVSHSELPHMHTSLCVTPKVSRASFHCDFFFQWVSNKIKVPFREVHTHKHWRIECFCLWFLNRSTYSVFRSHYHPSKEDVCETASIINPNFQCQKSVPVQLHSLFILLARTLKTHG